MNIGRSAPRHQQLALLYTKSTKLQACINEYYIVAVDFCRSLLLFTKKSNFGQIATSFSDASIKATQSELSRYSKDIENEIRTIVANRFEEEAKENSRFRSLSTRFLKTINHQQELAVKLRILEKCSIHDHITTWKQIRKLGNTTLFSQSVDYQRWKSQPVSSTLIYLGKLGCGKSVTMANIVDDLNLFVEDDNASIVFFFVQSELSASTKGRIIIGSIVRQMLQSVHDVAYHATESSMSIDYDDMLRLLRENYPPGRKTYLVLDGLHLCDLPVRQEVKEFLQRLQLQMFVLVCVSYRHGPNIDH